ncbi:MAG: hypothetical protein HY701_00825 [Gemmatimonadetes bacterium]|nr:hypothetical protein [Gemmatimonadota bacterium]
MDYGPGEQPGQIVYLKSSLSGREPHDVLAYRAEHPQFPHEPTRDQFFDERQFESYRALGYFIASQLFDANATDVPDIAAWFEARRHEARRTSSVEAGAPGSSR